MNRPMNRPMNGHSDDTANSAAPMSAKAFLALGSMHVAYVKPVTVDGTAAYAVHAANGDELAIFNEREVAFVAARQNDLDPLSVH